MSYDGNGNYNLPSPQFPAVPGTIITSQAYNAILQDIAAALSLSLTRDGQAPMIGDLKMGGQRISGLAPATANGQAVAFEQLSGATSSAFLNVKDFGAKGDGVSNDSTAIASGIAAAQTANASLYFPAGTYPIPTLAAQSGKINIWGNGDAIITGSFRYIPPSNEFPKSVDTLTPPTPTAAYITITGLIFQSVGGDYGLVIDIPFKSYFYQVGQLRNLRFHGRNGLFMREVVTATCENLQFYNTAVGVKGEAISNIDWIGCVWHNQAAFGVLIVPNANGWGGARYLAGENCRFLGCEWAGCTTGLYLENHGFGYLTNCLFDYCTNPLNLYGTSAGVFHASQTYFGVSNIPKNGLGGVLGYVPTVEGLAVYARFNSVSGYPTGGHFSECQFVRYPDVPATNTQPLVYFDGASATGVEDVSFSGCKFYVDGEHQALNLLAVTFAQIVKVHDNVFTSYRKSTTLTDAYSVSSATSFLGYANDTLQLRNTDDQYIPPSQDTLLGSGSVTWVYVQDTDPGAVGVGKIWVTP